MTFELVLSHLRKRDFAVLSTISKGDHPEPGTVQALRLSGESYEAAARLDETTPAALQPLTHLTLDPTAVWR